MPRPLLLKQLKQDSSGNLRFLWADGHQGIVTLERLRDRCPCASCSGEQVLLAEYVPPSPDTTTPGRYTLKRASPVGNYALKLSWGDGHDLGLYTWELLRTLCECDECSSRPPAWNVRESSRG